MTVFNALVSLNADSRFDAYQPGHRMFTTTALFTTVVADTVEEALDKVWVWGNKMSVEAGRQYPAETRSLSVGDVVTVRDNQHHRGHLLRRCQHRVRQDPRGGRREVRRLQDSRRGDRALAPDLRDMAVGNSPVVQ